MFSEGGQSGSAPAERMQMVKSCYSTKPAEESSVTCLSALHAGEVKFVKSPASISAVGMIALCDDGADR